MTSVAIPAPVNQTVQTANDLIHAALFGAVVNAVIVSLNAELPWLNWPLISEIEKAVLDKIAGEIYTTLSQFVTFAIIDSQIAGEKEDYSNAEKALRDALAKTPVDLQAIANAKAQMARAFDSVLRAHGAAA